MRPAGFFRLALAALSALWLASSAPRAGAGDFDSFATADSIEFAVNAKFLDDPLLLSTNIDVHFQAGTVVLMGQVRSRAARARAAQLALEVEGVQWVVNRLTVENVVIPD